MDHKKQQCLEILDLKPGVSPKKVKSAYRKMAMRTHPDKGGLQKDFEMVKQAYDYLVKHGKKVPKPKVPSQPEVDFSQAGFDSGFNWKVYHDYGAGIYNGFINVNTA